MSQHPSRVKKAHHKVGQAILYLSENKITEALEELGKARRYLRDEIFKLPERANG